MTWFNKWCKNSESAAVLRQALKALHISFFSLAPLPLAVAPLAWGRAPQLTQKPAVRSRAAPASLTESSATKPDWAQSNGNLSPPYPPKTKTKIKPPAKNLSLNLGSRHCSAMMWLWQTFFVFCLNCEMIGLRVTCLQVLSEQILG